MPAPDFQTVQGRAPDGVTLDKLPSGPPDVKKTGGSGVKLGEFGSSPGLMALQGLEQIDKGFQLVVAGIPQLPPMLIQMGATWLTQLRQAVPQALGGGGGPFPPSGILTPPPGAGVAPGAPPGIGAQGGAPGAPTPLPQGLG